MIVRTNVVLKDCIEKGKEGHEEWCHLLKTAMEDYKHEKSLGHQVQKYVPPIAEKYCQLPASIAASSRYSTSSER